MCFFKAPKLQPLPQTPRADSEEVRRREALERQRLAAQGGTASTVKTDLAPSAIAGQRRVLLGV